MNKVLMESRGYTFKSNLGRACSAKLFTQLCEAVQYLHNSDVVHRDLKCENLLLDKQHNLKVCDFGFSKRLTHAHGHVVLSETFCGTSTYAAPEISRNVPYDPKVSDVWSMGVVLYMMLHASMPYDATNVRKMVRIQIQHIVNFPDAPSVSPEAKDLIRTMLNPVVEQRTIISNILQSSWMLLQGRVEDSAEAPHRRLALSREVLQRKRTKRMRNFQMSTQNQGRTVNLCPKNLMSLK
ncbi:hypothetical protein F7725_026953 [Dissostichus mawsoni]|uniref:non-specific serine/threonine protein kinase n=1 Tax=Dissostichus mawsoni TaxID=36200 RepID=A0A7J5XA33_DISMA|nr:hypothetical protein F7725_026953 [Dissostichus mawsoni]